MKPGGVFPLCVKIDPETGHSACEDRAKFCFCDRIGRMSTSAVEEDADSLTIGRRIRQLRTARGMTLDDLAAAVDRAPSQMSMIETGKREPKLTQLQAIARALGVTIDALLEAEPLDERSAIEIALEHLHQQGARLIDESPRPGGRGARIAFVHPADLGGTLIELVELPG